MENEDVQGEPGEKGKGGGRGPHSEVAPLDASDAVAVRVVSDYWARHDEKCELPRGSACASYTLGRVVHAVVEKTLQEHLGGFLGPQTTIALLATAIEYLIVRGEWSEDNVKDLCKGAITYALEARKVREASPRMRSGISLTVDDIREAMERMRGGAGPGPGPDDDDGEPPVQ